MTGTDPGLVVGARAFADDEFLRLDRTIPGQIDFAAEIGATPARKTDRIAARNAPIAGALVPMWRESDRWLAYSHDRNRYVRAERYSGAAGSYTAVMWAVHTLINAGLLEQRSVLRASDEIKPKPAVAKLWNSST